MVTLLLKTFYILVINLAAFIYGKFLRLCVYVALVFWKDEEEKSVISRRNMHHILVWLPITLKIQVFFFFIEFGPTSPWCMIRAKAFLNMHLLCVHLLCGLTSFCSSFCTGNLCCSLLNIMWHWQMLKRQSGVITVVHCHLLCIFNGMSQPVRIFQHLTIPFLLWRCCWHIWR